MTILKETIKNVAKTIIILAFVVMILVLILGKIFNPNKEENSNNLDLTKNPTIKVQLAKASNELKEEKTINIRKTGTILAGQEVSISSEISANIANLSVKEGMVVKKGQILATLGDSTQLKNAIISYNNSILLLNNAQNLLNIAIQSSAVSKSTYNEQFENALINIEKAAIQLESTPQIRYLQEDIGKINEATKSFETELNSQNSNSNTDSQSIQTENSVATLDLNAYNSANTDEANYYQEYLKKSISDNQNAVVVKNEQLSDIQAAVQDDNNFLNLRSAELQLSSLAKQLQLTDLQNQSTIINASNQILQIKQQLETAKISLSQGKIISPIDGVITTLNVTNGDKINPNEELFKIVNLNQVNVKLFLSANEVVRVLTNKSDSLKIEIESLGVKVPAKISFIGVIANSQTKTIPVEIVPIFNKNSQRINFIPNTFAKVSFIISDSNTNKENRNQDLDQSAFTIPATALLFEDGKIKVAAIENNQIVKKQVQLSPPIKNGRVAIKSGINDGTEILLDPKKISNK